MLFRSLSRFLSRNPKWLFAIQEKWLGVGHDVLDLRGASWVIRRPEWLRKKSGSVKLLEPELGEKSGDIEVAERCINAYRTMLDPSSHGARPEGSIWGTLLGEDYKQLRTLIERGDTRSLARHQAKIFRTSAVNGFAYGNTFDPWPHRWHYLPVQIELSVVQLAEAIGVLRAECHEQGHVAFWRSILSEEELIERIENYFGFRVEHPRFGDPRGIMFGGRFLTRETCSHLYTADRVRRAIRREKISEPLRFVEIGGGYGGMCYWLCKVLGDQLENYVIVDLPEVGLVQAFFLASVFPDKLILRGEAGQSSMPSIKLVAHFELDEIGFRPNVLMNQDSMPEMPEAEVVRYLGWATENLDGVFISFNQETLSPNNLAGEYDEVDRQDTAGHGAYQIWVPEVVRRFPRFQLASRDTSWDRRGYVEEIYVTL
ncbi:putative sugar O-methyltransferase [Sphingopyxis sp.]|uniref:putative sugar O-methyltransferase n=1 Tax=Sphingopyxis sp. TaxID=1908224 RepID=UPI002E070B33|nr:putative sugar O-methyltransferase [Sphingopyxis sp.]